MQNNYSQEFARKQFTGETMKAAYLAATKWVATNVISKAELRNDVLIKYEKIEVENQLPTITVHLYVSIMEKNVRDRHCTICREMHQHFYISEETNCSWCKIKGFQNRADEMIRAKRRYLKEKLKVSGDD